MSISIVESANQIINLLYNEPVPAVRATLAVALQHAFAAISNAANPRISEHGSGAPAPQINAPATGNDNEHERTWDEHQFNVRQSSVTENGNASYPRQQRGHYHQRNTFQTIPYQYKSEISRSQRKRAEWDRKRLKSPKIRQETAHKKHLSSANQDVVTWAHLGILEERLTIRKTNGTVVSETSTSAENLYKGKAMELEPPEVCETSSVEGTVLHFDTTPEKSKISAEMSVLGSLHQHTPNIENSSDCSESTILPEDSASNVQGTSTLGSLMSTVTTLWNKPKATKEEVCLEAYQKVYNLMRNSEQAKGIKDNCFRTDTKAFEAALVPALKTILNTMNEPSSKYLDYIRDNWVVERNAFATLYDPDDN